MKREKTKRWENDEKGVRRGVWEDSGDYFVPFAPCIITLDDACAHEARPSPSRRGASIGEALDFR